MLYQLMASKWVVGSTICLGHCAAKGQKQVINNFSSDHLSFVSERRIKGGVVDHNPMGIFHLLPPESQRTAILQQRGMQMMTDVNLMQHWSGNLRREIIERGKVH